MRTFSLIAVLLALATSPAPLAAQPAPAGVVTTLVGQVTVARAAAPAPVALKFKDSVFLRDRIETRQDSVVRVLLGGRALVTVRELSVFTVTEGPGRARIDLSEGKLAVGVAKSLLRPGEAIEIRTPNAVAAVRGSELVAEVTRAAGVPQTTFTALEISLPITVTPLGAGAAVTLGINQAVSLTGLANALTVSPVRNLTPAQAQDAARTGQAPKPKEQSDRPPERVTQMVSEEKTREAALLSEALMGSGLLVDRRMTPEQIAELTGFKVTDLRTSDLFIATSNAIDEVADVSKRGIEEAAEAEPPLNPQFTVVNETIAAGPDATVKTYAGVVRETFTPVADIFGSTIDQSGPGTFFRVEPGASVTIPGFLASAQDSTLRTGGSILTVGTEATVTVGLGIFPLLEFIDSTVVTGAEMVAIGAGARLGIDRNLIGGTGSTLVAGAVVDGAPFVSIGEGAQVRTGVLPFLSFRATTDPVTDEVIRRGSVTTTGPLLSIGRGATLTSGAGLFGVLTASATDLVAGAEIVAIEPGARVELNQGLVSGVNATFFAGASRPASLLRIGAQAEVITDSITQLLLVGGGNAIATESIFLLEEDGAVLSRLASTTPLLGFVGTEVLALGDVMTFAARSRLELDRLIAAFDSSTVDVGGSLLRLAADAVISLPEPLGRGAMIFIDSLVRTGADVFLLEPAAALSLRRPFFGAEGSALISTSGSLLGLGAGARLTSPEVTFLGLLFLRNSLVDVAADLVHLGPAARVELVQPLMFVEGSSLAAAGSGVFLDEGARFVSSGQTNGFVQLTGTDLTTGDAFAVVHHGARVDLGRTLLRTFDSTLTLGRGFLSVAPGGQVVMTGTEEPLVLLGGGVHQVGTEPGSAMFSLAGSATALDVESGLTVGTDRPVQLAGSLLSLADGVITTQQAVRLDTALLEASKPLLQIVRSSLNVVADAVDLSLRSKVTALGPFLTLDAGTINVLAGALVNVAGGSFLKVVGDFLDLRNGSAVNLLNGPLLSVSGGSAVNITGGLVSFGGTGGNQVNVANNLCPCTTLAGVPVAFHNGASPANVSIGPNPIRNGNLGTLGLASPNAAAIVVSGPTSRVTIGAP